MVLLWFSTEPTYQSGLRQSEILLTVVMPRSCWYTETQLPHPFSGIVVQWFRTLPCHGRGRGFKSHLSRFPQGLWKTLWCSKNMRKFFRIWKYALGSFSDDKTKKYDNHILVLRTFIFFSYLITNIFIIAGVIRHW